VPLPQLYFDDNAWRIPLKPVVAKEPAMIKGRFLRGAIALAVNGIPIFNPQNNRGEISYEIGELDKWAAIADARMIITTTSRRCICRRRSAKACRWLMRSMVIPFTASRSRMAHRWRISTNAMATRTRRSATILVRRTSILYVFGGFHGEVVEREEQVDPQPRAQGVREALTALRGAKITAFESTGKDSYKLSYDVNGDKRSVSYSIKADGTYPFHFDNGRDGTADEAYTARRQGGGGGGDRPPGGGGPEGMKGKGKGKGQGKGSARAKCAAMIRVRRPPSKASSM